MDLSGDDSIYLEKAALRKRVASARSRFFESCERYKAASIDAQKILMRSDAWRFSARVALYAPLRGETDTALLDAAARAQDKTVLYPRCVRNTDGEPLLEFAVCAEKTDLKPGSYGIFEPAVHIPAETAPPDMLVLPAVALDESAYRLGYGGGYYDRLLALPAWRGTVTVGLVFSFQLFKRIPRSPWDKPLCGAVTERGCIWL